LTPYQYKDEQLKNEQIANEHKPHIAAEREDLVVVEEPHLRQDQGGGRQRPHRRLEEEDERNHPDEVLRREEPCEGEKARDRRGEGKREPPRVVAAAQVEPRDRNDGERLR